MLLLRKLRIFFTSARDVGARTALVALLLACCGCGRLEERAWKSHKKPPQVSFDHARHELGEVRQGRVIEHDFPFRNVGELDLSIDRTRSTAECAVTLPEGRTVRGSGSGRVRVELDTKSLSGKLRRTITVYTNDPRKRTVLLTLTGTVIADITVRPRQLYIGRVTRGSLTSKAFTVTSQKSAIRAGARSEDNPYVTLRSRTSSEQPETVELEIHVSEGAPFGPFDEIVRLPTNSSDHPVLRLRIAGIVQPTVTASPNRLRFGDTPRNEATVRQFLVRNRGRDPIRVEGAEWVPSFGTVEVDTLRKGRRYRVRAVLDRNANPGDITSVIRLVTDDPAQPHIEIPVEGRVVKSSS